jgi:sporulation protein YqfC
MSNISGKNPSQDTVNLNKLDVPFPLLYGGAHIEMFGNRKLSFEGKYTILEYTEEIFKIKVQKKTICIYGTALNLSNVNDGSFLLTGRIINIEFEGGKYA